MTDKANKQLQRDQETDEGFDLGFQEGFLSGQPYDGPTEDLTPHQAGYWYGWRFAERVIRQFLPQRAERKAG